MQYCASCKQTFSEEAGSGGKRCPNCGGLLASRKILPKGTVINGFTILSELGHGGMGVVYLARQDNLKRYVAFKVLEDSLTGDEKFVEGFFREARAAASLSHPNIVQAYDAGITENGIYFFVMELIDGENLDRYIEQYGAVDIMKGLKIAERIADALAYAWERKNLCHGDIKPENIILKPDGEVKLADLGLARDYRNDRLKSGEIMATPAYAPPEIIRAEFDKIGCRSDMYSFGATLYHLFAGIPPFPGSDPEEVCRMQLNNQPKPLIAVNNEIPSPLSMLVDKLMEKSPNNRPETWSEVVQEIRIILDGMKSAREKTEKVLLDQISDRRKTKRIYRLLIFLSAGFILFTVLILLFLLVSGKPLRTSSPPPLQPHPVSTEGEDASGKIKAQAQAKWRFLKTKLSAMPPADAYAALKKFIDEYPLHAPRDAQEYLQNLEKLIRFSGEMSTFLDYVDKFLLKAGKKQHSLSGRSAVDKEISAADDLLARFARLSEEAVSLGISTDALKTREPALLNFRKELEDRRDAISKKNGTGSSGL